MSVLLSGEKLPGARVEVLTTSDGPHVRAVFVPAPVTPSRGTVVVLNGRSEFIEKYVPVLREVHERDFAAASLDWRGQGLSERLLERRLPGYVRDFEEYQKDLSALVEAMADMPRPWIVLAHSMAGCILAETLARPDNPFDAAIMTAPMFGLALNPLASVAGRVASRGMVWAGQGHRYASTCSDCTVADWGFENNVLTSDRAGFDRYAGLVRDNASLALGGATWRWLRASLDAMDRVAALPRESVRVPLLMVRAGADTVIDNHAIARFADRNTHATIVTLDGSRHEPLIEAPPIREALWQAIDRFLDDVAPATR